MLSGCWKSRLVHRRRLLGKSGSEIQRCARSELCLVNQQEVVPGKASKLQLGSTVPQTDTGGRDEYSQALERTQEKELGKLIP